MRILTPCLIMLGTLVWPSIALTGDIAFNNGGWTTSFDYGQECSVVGAPVVECRTTENDGINWDVPARPQSGNYTSAVIAANNPDGNGGMGARFWTNDGTNKNTIEIRITFPSLEPEFWIRWYQRYEAGYQWSSGQPNYDKTFYFWENGPGGKSILFEQANGGFSVVSGSVNFIPIPSKPLISWNDVFGASSDGLFHMFELHIKADTDGTDGVAQGWIDGVKILDSKTVDFNGLAGIARMDFHQNQSSVSNGRAMYVDYDDIAIYTTTPPNISPDGDPWIGPLNGFSGVGSLPKPKSPAPVGVSFNDLFENAIFMSRGWYDQTSMLLENPRETFGSAKSIEYRFASGATQAVR